MLYKVDHGYISNKLPIENNVTYLLTIFSVTLIKALNFDLLYIQFDIGNWFFPLNLSIFV